MAEPKKQPRVIIFTTPTCGYCTKAKRYFKQNGIKFREVDISRDPEGARDAARLSHGTSVPVILVGGSVVVGFNQGKLDRALGLKSRPDEDDMDKTA